MVKTRSPNYFIKHNVGIRLGGYKTKAKFGLK